MAYSVNWTTKVITIPKADTNLVSAGPPEVRELDATVLWQNLIDIEDSVEGIIFDQIVENQSPISISNFTLARVVEIINGYTLTFDDSGGTDAWTVNIIGGNTNVSDVKNENLVAVNTANSAGLVVISSAGEGISGIR